MWDFEQPHFEGRTIPTEQAWRTLEDWRAAGKEIGVWFVARSGSVRTLGTVESARNGRVELRGSTVTAGFDLRQARFTYAATQIFPRWPMGPAIPVMALHAFFPTGDWLMMAEGMRPESLPPLALPE